MGGILFDLQKHSERSILCASVGQGWGQFSRKNKPVSTGREHTNIHVHFYCQGLRKRVFRDPCILQLHSNGEVGAYFTSKLVLSGLCFPSQWDRCDRLLGHIEARAWVRMNRTIWLDRWTELCFSRFFMSDVDLICAVVAFFLVLIERAWKVFLFLSQTLKRRMGDRRRYGR